MPKGYSPFTGDWLECIRPLDSSIFQHCTADKFTIEIIRSTGISRVKKSPILIYYPNHMCSLPVKPN